MTAGEARAEIARKWGAWGALMHPAVGLVQGCERVGCITRPTEGMFQRDEGGADKPITLPAGNDDLNPPLFPPAASPLFLLLRGALRAMRSSFRRGGGGSTDVQAARCGAGVK